MSQSDQPPTPSLTKCRQPGDQFLEMAEEWGKLHGYIIDCRQQEVSDRARQRIHHLAFNLMAMVREYRPDLDVLPLAELSVNR